MSSKKSKRPKRTELTTATARAERRERAPREYNLLESAAPLAPQPSEAVARFAHDEFVEQRRFTRANPQGESERRFDADQFAATDAYRRRLETQALDHYTNTDPLIDEEREAAYVEQPAEAIAQFRADLNNQEFIETLASRRIASSNQSSALARRRQLELQRQRVAEQSAAAFTTPHRRADALWVNESNSSLTNPDRMFVDDERRLNGPPRARADEQIEADRALLREIENEIEQLDDIDDDEDIEDIRVGELRRNLEEERQQVQQRLDEYERRDNNDDEQSTRVDEQEESAEQPDATVQSTATTAASGKVLANLPMISKLEARDLLNVNALHMLDSDLRGPFMQLSETAMIWQLLQAHVLQHEQHKRHVHLIELVRAMALRGAKYAGLAHVATASRLGELVDCEFFDSFIDRSSGRLTGGHEHCVNDTTRFVVLKFYCVRRNKNNSSVIDGAQYAESGATTGASADKQMHRLLERSDINAKMNAGREHTRLNRAGLYDAHNTIDEAEDDGTDEYSSLHDIKYLDKEFMFCVRLVCVEAADVSYGAPTTDYVSEDEEEGDRAVLPPELVAQLLRTDSLASGTSLLSSTRGSSDESTRSSGAFSASLPSMFDQSPRHSAAYHSDDDEQEAQRDLQQHRRMAASAVYMPGERINISLDEGRHFVGKWHAGRFIQHVNGHQIGPLCVRAFLFYVNDSQRRK